MPEYQQDHVGASDGNAPRIWICDDSQTERAITRRVLAPAYACEQMNDGSELVARLERGDAPPDLIVLDWVMPGMSGDQVCQYLQSRPELRTIPVIIATATRTETEDLVLGLKLGATDYLPRPFVPEELRARVEALLRVKLERDRSLRERARLSAVNSLTRAVFTAPTVAGIVDELARQLTVTLCDGCAIVLFPTDAPMTVVSRHRGEAKGEALALIGGVADPAVHAFEDRAHALRELPPMYHAYVHAFGLRGLAVMPFPGRGPVSGIVTVTRDGDAQPFDADDLATIETCIDLVGLAVSNALRLDAERRARAELSAVIDHAPIGIVVANPDGVISLTNAAAAELVPGITRSGSLRDVLAALGAPAGQLEQPSSRGEPRQILVAIGPRKLAIATVHVGDRAAPTGTVSTIEDVTAAHALLAERERMAGFQERMLGIVGHDLRSPLSAISAGVALLELRSSDHPALVKVVPRLQSSVARMTTIIDQLLDVTRARLGSGIPINARDVELVDLVRSIVDEHALSHAGTRFVLTAPDEVSGRWDPGRLGQVISNLLGNAVQYGRAGAPVAIEVVRHADTAVITVRNELRGEPLTRAQIATLFDAFSRGPGTGLHVKGLGLGLYITAEIVRAHGGSIEVESSSAGGTVFRVMLPVARAAD